MFRKGALPIVVLSAICAALFYWWIGHAFKEMIAIPVIIFLTYFIQFVVIIGSIYDIIHKVKIKYNKNLLKMGICGVILFTALFKGFEYSSIFLAFIFITALVFLIIFANIGIQYEKSNATKEE